MLRSGSRDLLDVGRRRHVVGLRGHGRLLHRRPGHHPPSPTAPADCAQSEANYPHLIASALRLSLTDVSCSGAKTESFTVAQFPDQPPQFKALTPSTKVVTVGMGGNDGNLFGTLMEGCTALDFGKPNVGAPCQEHFEAFVTKCFRPGLRYSSSATQKSRR